jgi:ribosomal protein S18 acetylase RimI-like enzyme
MEMVRKDIEGSRREGGVYCGLIAADGTMIGVVDYIPGDYEGDSSAAFLSLLMIAGPYRSRGIGTAAVEAMENEIRKNARVTTILAGVQVNNPRAVRFWQRNGYRIVSGPELMPDRTIAFRLRKVIHQEN